MVSSTSYTSLLSKNTRSLKKLNLSELKLKLGHLISVKSKTRKRRKPWKLFFRVFDFEYWIKIEKSEEKKSEINFRGFRVFDLAEESFNVT